MYFKKSLFILLTLFSLSSYAQFQSFPEKDWNDPRIITRVAELLNQSKILALSDIILHIENHYGFPVDIEWAYEKGKFYILQSRPITTLN